MYETRDSPVAAPRAAPDTEPADDVVTAVSGGPDSAIRCTLPSADALYAQMFRDIIVNRSLPSLRNMMSRQPAAAVATLLRTPDANRDNATPFLLACLSGNQSICEYLFELGSDIRAKSSRFGPCPPAPVCYRCTGTHFCC